jgi:hypothetical protein
MKYPDNAITVKVAPGIYSYLSPAQLKELKRCISIAYPQYSAADRRRQYVTLACQPEAAKRFVSHPDFSHTTGE